MPANTVTDLVVNQYIRQPVPQSKEGMDIYLSGQLQEIENSMKTVGEGSLQVADAAPERPLKGMLRYAISPWDPLGSGFQGLVVYSGTAWLRASDPEGRVSTLEGTTSSQASSISSLQSSLSTAEGNIATNASNIATNTSDISSNASATTALTTRVTAAENNITSQASSITTLQSDLSAAESDIATNTSDIATANTNITANAAATTALTTRVTAAENNITSQASSITTLQSDLSAAESDIATNTSNISSNASATTDLTTRVTAAENNITSQASSITTLQSDLSAAQSDISANTSDIATANTNITANASATTALTTRVTTAENDITAVEGDISTAQSDITALSSSVTSLSTTVGNNTTSITTNTSSINGIEGRYGVTIDNNSKITGFQLLSGAGTGSAFDIRADRFNIFSTDGTTSDAPFSVYTSARTVNGINHPAGVYIEQAYVDAASIIDGTITNAKIGSVLQSSNYSSGSTGWQINKNGSAEFNGVVISRQLQVDSGSYSAGNVGGTSNNDPTELTPFYIQTNINVSAWAGTTKTYVVAIGNSGSVTALTSDVTNNPTTIRWGFRGDIVPLTQWSGTAKLWIKVTPTVSNVVSTSLTLSWKVYEVT